jgi:hypothetical protein
MFEDHLCYPTSDTVKEDTYLHQTSIIKKPRVQIFILINILSTLITACLVA